jgi:hypothetical protein
MQKSDPYKSLNAKSAALNLITHVGAVLFIEDVNGRFSPSSHKCHLADNKWYPISEMLEWEECFL